LYDYDIQKTSDIFIMQMIKCQFSLIINFIIGSNYHKLILFLFIACESGTFGQNCANTCHCINQPCDPITGVCPPGGCERGYTSSNCSTGI